MKGLSILIPEYNDDCVVQVKELAVQCKAVVNEKGVGDAQWEIIVADDGSSDKHVKANEVIATIDGCRFIKRGKNHGRSSTRNFLAREAKYDTLLYIDAGLKPNPRFVGNYVENIGKSLVICGNIAVDKECINLGNLRCKNELKAQKRLTAAKHALEPYKNFHSGNFLISRRVMLDIPFREDITTYGYEDTLLGKCLAERHVSILHIDNPASFVSFESNARFLEKTAEAIGTLYNFRGELQHYSPLLHLATVLQRWHLLGMASRFHRCFGNGMRANLEGDHPDLRIYAIYRLCLLANLFVADE